MSVAVLAPDGERQRLQRSLRQALGVSVHGASLDNLDALLGQPSLRLLVAFHEPGTFEGLSAAAELLRCRGDVVVVIVARGGDEALAVNALKAGAADYLPVTRIDELPGIVRELLNSPPRVATEQALRDTQASLLLALRAARIGAWEWDLLSGIAHSENVAEAVNLPQDGHTFPVTLDIVHPDERDDMQARLERIIRGEDNFPIEFRLATDDGTVRWAYATGHIERAVGHPVFARGIVMDISPARHAEARHLRARRHEALGVLAGSIAHDLNNVLAPIQLSVDLLRSAQANQGPILDTIGQSVSRGIALLRQVLEFARGQDNDFALVRLDELLAPALLQLTPTLPPPVRLHTHTAPGLAVIKGDEKQLLQALCHLVNNAVEAMPEGGTISVTAENVELSEGDARLHSGASTGRHVLLTVSDTGGGFPSEELNHVFDPFFTTKSRERHAGLGLAVVRGVVRRHGGVVEADNLPTGAARVRIWLPAAFAVPAGSGKARLILLADDAPAALQAGREALEKAGFRVMTATNGAEALLAHHSRPSEVAIAILAATLPILDGPSTLLALRRTQESLPMLLMTRGDPPSAELLALGGVHCLAQPVSPEALVAAVQSALAPPVE